MRHDEYIIACLIKSGFDPNQPRVPAGNSDGGQWTGNGGTRSTGTSAQIPRYRPSRSELEHLYRLDPPIRSVYPVETILGGISGLARSSARVIADIDRAVWGVRRATDTVQSLANRANPIGRYRGDTYVQGQRYSWHTDIRGPQRKIPPSVVRSTIERGQRTPSYDNTTAFYDPINNVTVIRSNDLKRIVTVRKGKP